MKSQEFKIVLSVQIITLILVAILFFNNLSVPKMPIANVAPAEMNIPSDGQVKIDSQNDFVLGNSNAPNFLIVFSNYNCDVCKYFHSKVVDSLNESFIKNGQLKIIYKEFVDTADKQGMLMAKIAEVARQTNRFEEVHKLFTSDKQSLDSTTILKLAKAAGITEMDINERLNSTQTLTKIDNDNQAAKKLNITGTPSFVLNGQVHPGYMTYQDIATKLQNL